MYGDSHVKDKTVARPSHIQHGYPYTGKTAFLYKGGPQFASAAEYTSFFEITKDPMSRVSVVEILGKITSLW